MSTIWCAKLDEYLGEELSEPERAIFVAHLESCADCQQAIQDHERLNQLLMHATTQLNPTPEALLGRIEHRLRAARRQRLLVRVVGLSTAALVACAIAAWWLTNRPALEPSAPMAVAPRPLPSGATHDPRSLVHVTFQPRDEVIVVPLQTTNPNVTIIWVYPAVTRALPAQVPPSDPFPEGSE